MLTCFVIKAVGAGDGLLIDGIGRLQVAMDDHSPVSGRWVRSRPVGRSSDQRGRVHVRRVRFEGRDSGRRMADVRPEPMELAVARQTELQTLLH